MLHQVLDDLVEVGVHALVHAEAQAQLHLEHEVGVKGVDHVLVGVGLVGNLDVEEVVRPRALGALVQDRVEDVAVELVERRVVGEEHQVVGKQRVGLVVREVKELVEVLANRQVDGLRALDGRAAAPDVHHEEEHGGEKYGDVAAVEELGEAREEEHELDCAKEDEEHHGRRRLAADAREVREQQQRGHEHGAGDGQAVGGLHVLGALEEQHHAHAANPHDVVYQRDVDLAARLGGVVDLHVGYEVEANGLRDDGVGARDEGLRRDDGRKGGEDHGKDAELLGQHLEERVEVRDDGKLAAAVVGDDPGALAQVVEDKAELHERPGEVDVCLAHVAHVGVEGLGAGGAQEDVAQYHEAGGVEVVVKEEHDAAQRVERAENVEVEPHVEKAGDAQEEEPHGHDRAKRLADCRGARLLHGKEDAENNEGDANDDGLVVSDDAVEEVDGAQALDGGGHGDGGGEDAVGEKCRASDHGGDDEPLAAAPDEAVQREDAALVGVVGLHGHQHVLDRGDERDGPDEQRQCAKNHVLAHGGQSAVAGHDGLEGVHGAGTDVTVDDAQSYKHHTC